MVGRIYERMHGPSSTSYVARPRINLNELTYNSWMTWHMKVSTFQNHPNKDSAELTDTVQVSNPESLLQSMKVKTVKWAQTSQISTNLPITTGWCGIWKCLLLKNHPNKDSVELADTVQVSNMPRVTTSKCESQNSKMGPN